MLEAPASGLRRCQVSKQYVRPASWWSTLRVCELESRLVGREELGAMEVLPYLRQEQFLRLGNRFAVHRGAADDPDVFVRMRSTELSEVCDGLKSGAQGASCWC